MRRDKNKKIKYIVMSTIALLVFTVTVAYAALNSQLIVSGNVNQKGGTWYIYLNSPSVYNTTGSAKSEKVELLNDNKTLNIYASLTQPGDSITYSFKIVNGGTIDAKLLKWGPANASEYATYKIGYSLTYSDGSTINPGDILLAKDNKTLNLTFTYNGTHPVTDEDKFISIQFEFQYGQVTAVTS